MPQQRLVLLLGNTEQHRAATSSLGWKSRWEHSLSQSKLLFWQEILKCLQQKRKTEKPGIKGKMTVINFREAFSEYDKENLPSKMPVTKTCTAWLESRDKAKSIPYSAQPGHTPVFQTLFFSLLNHSLKKKKKNNQIVWWQSKHWTEWYQVKKKKNKN